MDPYKTTFETWNKLAGLYQEKFMDLDLYNNSYDLFLKRVLKPNPVILEIGCGPGNISKYLLKKNPDIQIEGIDIAPNMIELAKINNPSAKFRVMDSRDIHSLRAQYDGIICGFCIPYLSESDCAKLILDCRERSSENAILYLSFVEGDYSKSGYLPASTGDLTYFYYHDLERLKKQLAENNFQLLDLLKVNYEKSDGRFELNTIMIAKLRSQ